MPDVINGELYLAKVLEEYLKYRKIKIVKTHFWVPIGNPTEYVNAHKMV
jgi:hypoxanthine phosphoribosyltransferase